jgi:hypothetical protein
VFARLIEARPRPRGAGSAPSARCRGARNPSRVTREARARVHAGVCALLRERFSRSLDDVSGAQRAVLSRILAANAQTLFGREHGFSSIRTVRDYQAAVPIRSHEDVDGLIQRIAAGEPNVLTRAPVDFIQLTSGSTTGRRKLAPSTAVYQREVLKAALASQGFLNRWAAARGLRRGPGIAVFGSSPLGRTKGGIPYGTASTGHARKSRRFWDWFSVVLFAATTVADPEARRYVYWRYALLAGRVSFVGAPFMDFLETFAMVLQRRGDELIRDVADGTLSASLALPGAQRTELAARLEPDRRRAAELERLASHGGGLMPRAVWPDLELVLAARSPVFAAYEARVADLYGPEAFWGSQYGSSEGLVGIPCSATHSQVPVVGTSFLEFIAEEDWHERNPRTHLVGDLRPGGRYEVVVTGWNGMYRYRLGDVIEVDGAFRGAPTFEVVSRRAGMLSAAGEGTTEAQVVAAVAECAARAGVPLVDFVVEIDPADGRSRYRLWAEPRSTVRDLSAIRAMLDATLRSVNPLYGTMRDRGEIGRPDVRLLAGGTFDRFRRRREREGGPSEQLKILHSSTDPGYVALFRREAERQGRRDVIGGLGPGMT